MFVFSPNVLSIDVLGINAFKNYCRITILAMLTAALSLVPAHAQVAPAAYGPGHSFWAGADYANISASFPYQSGQRLQGVGLFADFHVNYPLGFEGEARLLPIGGFQGSTESSYLAGPKVFFLARRKVWPYGKFLVGVGKIHYPFAIGSASYFALAPGAGAEYSVSRRWSARVEYEYQVWLGSPGYAGEPDHQLTPKGFHIGNSYRLF